MTDKHRINRVVTRTGDRGETGLADGSRVSKAAPVIEALGAIDELGAAIGVLLTEPLPDTSTRALLESVQQQLFEIGAELAVPGSARTGYDAVSALEVEAERLNQLVPPLKEFVLAGGSRAGAWCHFCRTVARRAERCLVVVQEADGRDPSDGHGNVEHINPASLVWLNRLSDLLFILARVLNQEAGVAETVWQPRGSR